MIRVVEQPCQLSKDMVPITGSRSSASGFLVSQSLALAIFGVTT